MALETATYISDLVATNPTATDPKSSGDDHLRLLKSTIKATFPNVNGAMNATDEELNYMVGATTQPAMKDGSNLVTPTIGDSSTKIATTAFVAATALASTLPAQTGNTGKLITTNGTTASWTSDLNTAVIRFADTTDATKKVAFDASGLTTATTRTMTVPNKSGTLAMTSDIPIPAVVLLATLTPTVSANLDLLSVFASGYDNYVINIDGLVPSSGTDYLCIRVASGGAAITTPVYAWQSVAAGGSLPAATAAYLPFGGAAADAAMGGLTMSLKIMNANSTTRYKYISSEGVCHGTATNTALITTGSILSNGSLSGIRLYWNGGATFAATGKIYVYGYSNT
jgi:hypothetical protein